MRPTDIRTSKYQDTLALERRRRFLTKATIITSIATGSIIMFFLVIFFSPWLAIKNVEINNIQDNHRSEINTEVEKKLSQNFLKIPFGHNILVLNAKKLRADLLEQFSFLSNVSIKKDYP